MYWRNLLCLLVLSSLLSCEEVPPEINPIAQNEGCRIADEQLVANQDRQVLIEEFSGVRCVNCPAGTEAIKALIDIYDEQLILVSIHAGSFANPYPTSLYDFQTSDGDNILNFLKRPIGYPSAVINRKLFPGENDLQLSQSLWANFVAQEVDAPPTVKLYAQPEFDAASKTLQVRVSVFVQETIAEKDVRMNVLLMEDNLKDLQKTPDGLQEDYKHRFVLRGAITNFDGNPIEEELNAGSKFCLEYQYEIPDGWNENELFVVAFVSLAGSNKEVLQAFQVKVN